MGSAEPMEPTLTRSLLYEFVHFRSPRGARKYTRCEDLSSKLEPVIRMSPENISVGVWKFEFNLGSNWKIQCYSI